MCLELEGYIIHKLSFIMEVLFIFQTEELKSRKVRQLSHATT